MPKGQLLGAEQPRLGQQEKKEGKEEKLKVRLVDVEVEGRLKEQGETV